MKPRDTYSLLLLLIIVLLSGCGDDDSDDDGTLNINEIVDNVEPTVGGGGGGGGGIGGGFSGGSIGDCTRIISIITDSISTAELNDASCQRKDFSDTFSGEQSADGYVVVLPSDGTFTVLMSSVEFDSVLLLFSCTDDNCDSLNFEDSNDDSGGGLNAEISRPLTAGTYLIQASEFDTSQPDGDYTLTTTFEDDSASL